MYALTIILSIFSRNYYIPNILVKIIKTNNLITTGALNEKNTCWEKTTNYNYIKKKYFKSYCNNFTFESNYYGEVFKIYGIPSAIIIIDNNLNKKQINEFIVNKNLIEIMSAKQILKKSFHSYYRNKNICIKDY
tara:strand:- start:397 stop:798 length:402 start_codon:yes stop_codon:yes gene_type:complete